MEDTLRRQSKIGNSHQVRSMTDQEDDYPIYYFTVMVSQSSPTVQSVSVRIILLSIVALI